MFNSQLSRKYKQTKSLTGSVCRFLWCKYYHHGWLQGAKVKSPTTKLGRNVYHWLSQADVSQLQNTTVTWKYAFICACTHIIYGIKHVICNTVYPFRDFSTKKKILGLILLPDNVKQALPQCWKVCSRMSRNTGSGAEPAVFQSDSASY